MLNLNKLIPLLLFPFLMCSLSANAEDDSPVLEFRLADTAKMEGWTPQKLRGEDRPIFVSDKAVLRGVDIEKVSFFDDERGYPVVGFTLTETGAVAMRKATSENFQKRLAIILDGKVVSAPVINATIGKEGVISGNFDRKDLLMFFQAIVLRSISEK